MGSRSYSVSEVARLTRLTVRTLHHYDAIGLLVPTRRGRAGYREYDASDLRTLYKILVLRELGLSLEAIGGLLAGDGHGLREALTTQHALLERELAHTQALVGALAAALDETEGMSEEAVMDKLFQGTAQFDSIRYQDEARERWGESAAYRESARRTSRYGEQDWARMRAESESLLAAWVVLMGQGEKAEGEAARAVAEQHRLHVDRWFYPCSHDHHLRLAALYVDDGRFADGFDRRRVGLAEFAAAAIRANANGAGRGEADL